MADDNKDRLKELQNTLKQNASVVAKSQDQLELSMKAIPATLMKGNEALRQAVMGERGELRAAIAEAMKESGSTEKEIAELQEKIAGEQEKARLEQIQKLKDIFNPSLQVENLRKGLQGFFGRDFKEEFFDSLSGFGDKIKDGLGNLKDSFVSKVKGGAESVGGFFLNLLKVIGGVVALQGFLNGLMKVNDWFGAEADLADRLAAGIAGIIGAFTNMSQEEVGELAVSISNVFHKIKDVITGLYGYMQNIFGDTGAAVVTAGILFSSTFRSLIFGGIKMFITTFGPLLFKGLMFLATSVGGAISTFVTGTLLPFITTTLAPMLVAAAPFIAVAAGVAAALAGLYYLLDFVSDKLGLDGVGDLLMVGVSYLQDALATVGNLIIDVVNGLVGKIRDIGQPILDFLGIDFKIPEMKLEKMATDNGEKALEAAREKKKQKEEERKKEEALKPAPATRQSDDLEVAQRQIQEIEAEIQRGSAQTKANYANMVQQNNVNNTSQFVAPSPQTRIGFGLNNSMSNWGGARNAF